MSLVNPFFIHWGWLLNDTVSFSTDSSIRTREGYTLLNQSRVTDLRFYPHARGLHQLPWSNQSERTVLSARARVTRLLIQIHPFGGIWEYARGLHILSNQSVRTDLVLSARARVTPNLTRWLWLSTLKNRQNRALIAVQNTSHNHYYVKLKVI